MRSLSRTRLIFLSLLAVMAVSAVSSASASAACNEVGETNPFWCVNNTPFYSQNAEVLSEGALFLLEAATLGVAIDCTSVQDTGTITQGVTLTPGEDLTIDIDFLGCTVESDPTHCQVSDTTDKVVGEILVKNLITLLVEISGVVYDTLTPETAPFTILTIANKTGQVCNAKGTFKVEGTACGQVAAGQAVDAVQTFSGAISTACGAALKLGTAAATLEGSEENLLMGVHEGQALGVGLD